MLRLGDKVTFDKHLVKGSSGVDWHNMTKEQEKELYDNDFIVIKKLVEKEHEPRRGIVVGKRRVGIESHLQYYDNPNGSEGLSCDHTVYETVYLIACNLNGFYKVRDEDIYERPLPF
jgi:hypothetical protein